MSMPVTIGGTPKNITSTGNVAGSTGTSVHLIGFYVNSTTGGTIVLRAAGSGGTAISGTITPAIGFHFFPAVADGPLHATIANTLDVTFFTTV